MRLRRRSWLELHWSCCCDQCVWVDNDNYDGYPNNNVDPDSDANPYSTSRPNTRANPDAQPSSDGSNPSPGLRPIDGVAIPGRYYPH